MHTTCEGWEGMVGPCYAHVRGGGGDGRTMLCTCEGWGGMVGPCYICTCQGWGRGWEDHAMHM